MFLVWDLVSSSEPQSVQVFPPHQTPTQLAGQLPLCIGFLMPVESEGRKGRQGRQGRQGSQQLQEGQQTQELQQGQGTELAHQEIDCKSHKLAQSRWLGSDKIQNHQTISVDLLTWILIQNFAFFLGSLCRPFHDQACSHLGLTSSKVLLFTD